jgi:hypothetical protein
VGPQDLERYIVLWGPGILILVIFGYGLMRLAFHWIDRTMEVKRKQMDSAFDIARDYVGQLAAASKSQATALSRLAEAVEHRDSVEGYEHQEMLVALKALHRNVVELMGQDKVAEKDASSLAAEPQARIVR